MKTLVVDHYEVEFGEEWTALVWDGHAAQKAQHRGTGSAPVDVVGLRANTESLMLELTDYRGFVAPERESLAEETAVKVSHTIAGVNGAARCTDETVFASSVALWGKGGQITVALCVDFDEPGATPSVRLQRREVREGMIRKQLRKRLAWLKARTVVCASESLGQELSHVNVRSVRGAGRGRQR